MTTPALPVNDRLTDLSPAAGTTALDYDFELKSEAGLSVIRIRAGVRATLENGTDYDFLSGLGDQTGGTVTLLSASLEGDRYMLAGLAPIERDSDFIDSQTFSAGRYNEDGDIGVIRDQEQRRDIDRSLKAEYGQSGLSIDTELVTAGKLLMRGEGDDIVAGPAAGDIPAAQGYAESALASKEAAELAAAGVAAVVAAVNIRSVDDDAGLLAAPTDATVLLNGDLYQFDANDLSTEVGLDTAKIGYKPLTADPSGASGAWLRNLKLGRISPEDAGVTGDDVSSTANLTRMQAAIDFAAREKKVLQLTPGGIYRIPGPMKTKTGTYIVGAAGAILRPTEWSILRGGSGAFLGNTIAHEDIVLENLHLDGSQMPANAYGLATAGTATTVTLDAWADGLVRVGDPVTFLYGTSFGRASFVLAWDPGSRILTLTDSGAAADATTFIGLGSNDNLIGFANGTHRARILGGYFENMLAQWTGGGSGGKINFEQGCTDCQALDYIAYRLGYGGFVQGKDGVNKEATQIYMRYVAKECGSAFTAAANDSTTDPDGDTKDNWIRVEVDFVNSGFQPMRPVSGTQTKSAAITFGEAQNVSVKARGRTTSDYAPAFPAVGTGFVGSGLSGNPIGSVVEGWGRNLSVDVEYAGACDALFRLCTPRASGFDAGRPEGEPQQGVPQNCYDLDIRIKHRGTAPTDGLFTQRQSFAVPVSDSEISGELHADCNYHPPTILAADMAYTGLQVEVGARIAGAIKKRGVIGQANLVQALHNSLTAQAGMEDLTGVHVFTLANNTATSFTPDQSNGVYAYSSTAGDLRGFITYNTAIPQCRVMTGPLLTAGTTGVLAGTTGTAGNWTFSAHTDGKIYLEHQRGGAAITMQMRRIAGL